MESVVVSQGDSDLDGERFECLELIVLLRGEGPQRHDVQRLATAKNGGEDREVGYKGLAARGRDREDEVLAEEGRADRIGLGRVELLNSLRLQDFHDAGVEP